MPGLYFHRKAFEHKYLLQFVFHHFHYFLKAKTPIMRTTYVVLNYQIEFYEPEHLQISTNHQTFFHLSYCPNYVFPSLALRLISDVFIFLRFTSVRFVFLTYFLFPVISTPRSRKRVRVVMSRSRDLMSWGQVPCRIS